jgi:hypothetical protein
MKKVYSFCTFSLAVSMVLSACTVFAPAPTPTPEPTNTPPPTATHTPLPTPTRTPTRTPTVKPTLALGDTTAVLAGGFSFRAPVGYQVDVQGAQVGVLDSAGTLIISIYGARTNPQHLTADEILDLFISSVFGNGNGEYEKGPSHPVTIDGVDGLAYDLEGTLFKAPVRGQAVIVMPSDSQYLFGLGVANTTHNRQQWEDNGSQVFSALLGSISFSIAGQANAASPCVVSTDSTYGYTKENAIKVGGGDFDGPSRERAYLNNLAGPNGEIFSYDRAGSLVFDDTILDAYIINGLGKSITLYIDEYAFTEPQAPVGFTCISEFPLSAP